MEGNCVLGYSKQMPLYTIWWGTLREPTKLKSVDCLDLWILNTSLWWNKTGAKLRLYVSYTSLRAVFCNGKSTGCALSRLVHFLKVLSPIFCLALVKNITDSYFSLLNYVKNIGLSLSHCGILDPLLAIDHKDLKLLTLTVFPYIDNLSTSYYLDGISVQMHMSFCLVSSKIALYYKVVK